MSQIWCQLWHTLSFPLAAVDANMCLCVVMEFSSELLDLRGSLHYALGPPFMLQPSRTAATRPREGARLALRARAYSRFQPESTRPHSRTSRRTRRQ